MFMFGAGDYGQLGTSRLEQELVPVKIDFYTRVHKISCGHNHTVILTESGRIYAAGSNLSGQLGTKNKKGSSLFVKTVVPETLKFKKISAGSHSAAISLEGDLYLWGTGTFGEYLTPQRIIGFKHPFKRISVGNGFGCCVDSKGNIYSWGHNNHGELGTGDYESRISPKQVLALQGKRVTMVSCGGNFALALGNTLSFNQESPGSHQWTANLDLIDQQEESLDLKEDKSMEQDRIESMKHTSSFGALERNNESDDDIREEPVKDEGKLTVEKTKPLEDSKVFQGKRNSFDSSGLLKSGNLSQEYQTRQSAQDLQASSIVAKRNEIESELEGNRNESQRGSGLKNYSLNSTPTKSKKEQKKSEGSEKTSRVIGNKHPLNSKKGTPRTTVDSSVISNSTKTPRDRTGSTPRKQGSGKKQKRSLGKAKEELSQDSSLKKVKKVLKSSKKSSVARRNTPEKQKFSEEALGTSKSPKRKLLSKSPCKTIKREETDEATEKETPSPNIEALLGEISSLKHTITELHDKMAIMEKAGQNMHEKLFAAKIQNLEENCKIVEKVLFFFKDIWMFITDLFRKEILKESETEF